MYCLDDPMEKLLLFRLTSGGGMACGPEARAEVVQQLAKLMAASIFSTDTVRGHGCLGERVRLCGGGGGFMGALRTRLWQGWVRVISEFAI